MKIKPRMIHGRWSKKLNTYGPQRDAFEKFEEVEVKERLAVDNALPKRAQLSVDRARIFKTVRIKGPKVEYFLDECVVPLKIVEPATDPDKKWITKFVPLFYVSPLRSGSMSSNVKIQGAAYFAEIDGELVAYRGSGAGFVEPL